jgi:hypothetical protein
MTNDYEGKLRYEARYQDLMKEAQGGWLLKAARPEIDARPARFGKLKRVIPLVWALVAAAIVLLLIAVSAAALRIV